MGEAELVFEEHLTPKEAAELAEVHRDTIYRWLRDGSLPSVKYPSGRYRIKKIDLYNTINQTPILTGHKE